MFILAAIGLPLALLSLEGFLFVLGVLHVFSLDVLRFLLAGLVFLMDAGTLTFSESVGDFFAERRGTPAIGDWSQTAPAPLPDKNLRGFQLDELLDASQIRTKMSRRIQRVTLVTLAMSWIIFLGGVGSGLYLAVALYRWLLTQVQSGAFMLLDYVWIGLLSSFLALVIPVAGYFLLFVLPFLLTLPFVLPFARRWGGPAKFLVLRPFNRDRRSHHHASGAVPPRPLGSFWTLLHALRPKNTSATEYSHSFPPGTTLVVQFPASQNSSATPHRQACARHAQRCAAQSELVLLSNQAVPNYVLRRRLARLCVALTERSRYGCG